MGLFALAFGLASNVLSPVQVMVGPMLPAFSALAERGPEAARAGLVRTTRIAATVAGAFVSMGVLVLAALVPTLYGSEYEAAAGYLVVLGASSSIVVAGSPSYASLMARLPGGAPIWSSIWSLSSSWLALQWRRSLHGADGARSLRPWQAPSPGLG